MAATPAPEIRAAVVADYVSGTPSTTVAARYGVSPSAVISWVRAAGQSVRGRNGLPQDDEALAYAGGWVVRGGVSYPLAPAQRSA